ncbi:MAG: hypothetical protein H6751_12715 [Candidatus Omnitrophica bacterium]|nr:hypothetical protein [Candidatus Omnitrophota bacterium]
MANTHFWKGGFSLMTKKHLPLLLILILCTPIYSQDQGVAPILENLKTKWKSVYDYSCQMQSLNRLGQEVDKKKLDFSFQRPHKVRMEVLDGPKKGSVIVRTAEEKIRAKKGGILGVVAVTLDENDERVTNLRGRKFYEADWGSVIAEWLIAAKNGWAMERLPDENYNNQPCHVLLAHWKDPRSSITEDKIWVNQDHLIVRRQQFEGQTLVNEVIWWNIQVNPKLDPGLFDL